MKYLALLFSFFFCIQSEAKEDEKLILKAAVAAEFKDGLHSKYLKYFAEKLNATIDISYMPFARRILQVKSGELDLIVGIQRTEDREDDVIYIYPHYESLSHRVFSLKGNDDTIKTYDDLSGKYIGITRYSRYFQPFDQDGSINKFKAISVLQNIELLMRKRTDAFMHYEESSLPLIESLGLKGEIVKTLYQPEHETHHYLAISKYSVLSNHRERLQKIVKAAIKNKDLLAIRLKHYANVNRKDAVLLP